MDHIEAWKLIPNKEHYTCERLAISKDIKSLNDISLLTPDSVYTTLRTYEHNKVMNIDSHFSRLEESAELAGFKIRINRSELRIVLRDIINKLPFTESRIRITINLKPQPGVIVVAVEELSIPSAEDYQNGVAAVTYQYQRQNPKAKLTKFLEDAEKIRQGVNHHVNEVLLIDENGHILEGLSSNFFYIDKDTLHTANEGILMGTIRSLVLDSAQTLNIPISYTPLRINHLPFIQETFITSTSRGVLPVVKINNVTIGHGKPGILTCKLMERFSIEVQSRLELL